MKKFLLIFALLCASAEAQILQQIMQPAPAASRTITLVQGKNCTGGGTTNCAFASNTTIHNLLVVCIQANYTVVPVWTVSDTPNGTYAAGVAGQITRGGAKAIQCWHVINGAGGASTVSAFLSSGTISEDNVVIAEFSSSTNFTATDGGTGTTGTTGTSGSSGSYAMTSGDLTIGFGDSVNGSLGAVTLSMVATDTFSGMEWGQVNSTSSNPGFTFATGAWEVLGESFK